MTALAEIVTSRELLANLTLRELRGKYKRSALGWAWSLVNPLVTMAVFTIVFSIFLKAKPDPGNPSGLDIFALWLLTGLLPWNFLANSLTGGMSSLVGNANLIKKVYFPRELLVGSAVGAWLVTFMIEMGVLACVLLAFGNMVLPWIPLLLVVAALQTVFVLGLALGFAVMNVYFRDVEHFLAIGLQVWFYATPVVYPMKYVHSLAKYHALGVSALDVYQANPMTQFAIAYRNIFYDLRFPSAETWGYLIGWTVFAILAGWALFGAREGGLAEEL